MSFMWNSGKTSSCLNRQIPSAVALARSCRARGDNHFEFPNGNLPQKPLVSRSSFPQGCLHRRACKQCRALKISCGKGSEHAGRQNGSERERAGSLIANSIRSNNSKQPVDVIGSPCSRSNGGGSLRLTCFSGNSLDNSCGCDENTVNGRGLIYTASPETTMSGGEDVSKCAPGSAEHGDSQSASHNQSHGHSNSHSHKQSHGHSHSFSTNQSHGHSHGGSECSSCGHHGYQEGMPQNAVQNMLRNVFKLSGLVWLSDRLAHNVWVLVASAIFLAASMAVGAMATTIKGSVAAKALCIAAFLPVGIPASVDLAHDLAGLQLNIHVLMSLAAFGLAFGGAIADAALLLLLFSAAHTAESLLYARATADVGLLSSLLPLTALLCPGGSRANLRTVPVAQVQTGDVLLVQAGEMVPLDGVIIEGKSLISVEHLTGEAAPQRKDIGDEVVGGSMSTDGALLIRVSQDVNNSTPARLQRLTDSAMSEKPKLQRWLDSFSDFYSKVVLGASFGIFALAPLLFGIPILSTDTVAGAAARAVGFMVAAAPCALTVAPLAYVVAVSTCARRGILLRGGDVLDALASCSHVAFDKTGTLTTGHLTCSHIEPLCLKNSVYTPSATGSDRALAIAEALERGATHPIAHSVIAASKGRDLADVEVTNFRVVPGEGVEASVSVSGEAPQLARMGNVKFVSQLLGSPEKALLEKFTRNVEGSRVIAVLLVGDSPTVFRFEDEMRKSTPLALRLLHKMPGRMLNVMMLTGDRKDSALAAAEQLEIPTKNVHFELLPEEKLAMVQSLTKGSRKGQGLLMVGEGINDAPALAAATVGAVVAHRASSTSQAVADVLLLGGVAGVENLPFLLYKAHQTQRVVKQGMVIALGTLSCAALLATAGVIPLWMTVLLHEGGTIMVCLNALRILRDTSPAIVPAVKKVDSAQVDTPVVPLSILSSASA